MYSRHKHLMIFSNYVNVYVGLLFTVLVLFYLMDLFNGSFAPYGNIRIAMLIVKGNPRYV